ncbi:MAG: cadherin-like beta sandwich domain-containing protein [Oscillospiraceae bacterium]|nr:cadherin-like beta sandwich domain-containing protein [Oscillospiraceae bacterium]
MANENVVVVETPATKSVNYAEKYSALIDERLHLAAITDACVNDKYDFNGVNKINVYSTDTAPINDYNRTASENRYGTPTELGNDVQEMTLTQDKSFTFTIDRGNLEDTELANNAATALQRQIDEVITPLVDKYRINKMCAGAGTTLRQHITSSNAYESFLDASIILTENKVPVVGRKAFVTTSYYKKLKLDYAFTGRADKANDIAINGEVGKIDGTPIILAPSEYFPEGTNFIITHPMATIGPVKIAEYKTHTTPQGVSGCLCEGRVYFDAFVLNNKACAIVVSKEPVVTLSDLKIGSITLTPTFDSAVTSYTGSTTTASNTVTITATDSEAILTITNGETEIESGDTASWSSGENTLTIEVESAGQTETYTVVITRT